MPKCKKCGKQFHACGSCGLNYDWEWEYCSESCWENSDAYKKGQEDIEEAAMVIASLTPEQCRLIHRIVDNPDLLDTFIDKLCQVMENEEEKSA